MRSAAAAPPAGSGQEAAAAKGTQCACALAVVVLTLQRFGCSRGVRGYGATGEAAQRAEIRPAAEVSRGSLNRAGGPADFSASGPGLSERAARSGLP